MPQPPRSPKPPVKGPAPRAVRPSLTQTKPGPNVPSPRDGNRLPDNVLHPGLKPISGSRPITYPPVHPMPGPPKPKHPIQQGPGPWQGGPKQPPNQGPGPWQGPPKQNPGFPNPRPTPGPRPYPRNGGMSPGIRGGTMQNSLQDIARRRLQGRLG